MISILIHNKLHLYRRTLLRASAAALILCSALALFASAYQHRASHRLRATALLELNTDPSGAVTTRLIPITILDQGRFRDASIYESKPRPMALENGVVYEAQKSGVPVGYVTISNGERMQDTWIASGKWQPVSEVQAAAAPKPASPQASSSSTGDDRPILHRGGGSEPTPQATPPISDSDRPILHRGEESQPQSQPQSQPVPDTSSTSDADAPADPNRPVLRRRTPASSSSASAPPAPQASAPAPTAPARQTVALRPLPVAATGLQTFVAVSDAQPSDTRSYDYIWKPGEQQQVEAKMRKLALAQLPNEATQGNEHSMTNLVIRAFDLDLSNDAVMVLTAEVPGGYLARGTKAAPGKFVSRYITLIARVNSEGDPERLAVSVTDSSQLDIAPRLEFIDAVDVDGDGLAELLFREYGADQKSFIIYGIGHGAITKVFEGASQSLK